MAADDDLYQDPDVFQGVADDNLVLKFLALNGINKMPRPFSAIPGRPEKPSFTCQEDNRTGIYFPELGVVGFVRNGVDVVWVLRDTIRIFDRYGNHIDLVVPTRIGGDYALSLPAMDGSIALKEHYISEEIIGVKDGVNTAFTVSHDIVNVLGVFLNNGFAIGDISWSPGSNSITWTGSPPNVSDSVYVVYIRE